MIGDTVAVAMSRQQSGEFVVIGPIITVQPVTDIRN
jgi:hypothetical protein